MFFVAGKDFFLVELPVAVLVHGPKYFLEVLLLLLARKMAGDERHGSVLQLVVTL